MSAAIPQGEPIAAKLVQVQTQSGSGVAHSHLYYEYQFPSGYVLIDIYTEKKDGPPLIQGLHINTLKDSLENTSKFSLSGKPFMCYLMLVLTTMTLFTTLYACFVWFRTRPRKKRWLLFILLGLGKFSVDWSTGECYINPLSINLFSAAAESIAYGPWMISCSLPLGAVLFLSRTRKSVAVSDGPIGGG